MTFFLFLNNLYETYFLGENFMKKIVSTLALVLIFSSCATQTTLLNNTYGSVIGESGTHNFFVAGIGQTARVNLDEACGEGYVASKTQTVNSPVNIVLSIITFGIYTPRDYKVFCSREED